MAKGENLAQIIAERLGDIRSGKGKTQTEVATQIGVNRTSIGHYEDAKSSPSVSVLKDLCEYYEVSADYLLGLSSSPYSRDDLLPYKVGTIPLVGIVERIKSFDDKQQSLLLEILGLLEENKKDTDALYQLIASIKQLL